MASLKQLANISKAVTVAQKHLYFFLFLIYDWYQPGIHKTICLALLLYLKSNQCQMNQCI